MSTAPLDREKQIEMMTNVAERHAAVFKRWLARDDFRQALRGNKAKPDDTKLTATLDSELRVRCG